MFLHRCVRKLTQIATTRLKTDKTPLRVAETGFRCMKVIRVLRTWEQESNSLKKQKFVTGTVPQYSDRVTVKPNASPLFQPAHPSPGHTA